MCNYSSDSEFLGCYVDLANGSNLTSPTDLPASPTVYDCLHACADGSLPLAAVFNGSDCKCASDAIGLEISSSLCNNLVRTLNKNNTNSSTVYAIYNTTKFLTTDIEVFQFANFKHDFSKYEASIASDASLYDSSPSVSVNYSRFSFNLFSSSYRYLASSSPSSNSTFLLHTATPAVSGALSATITGILSVTNDSTSSTYHTAPSSAYFNTPSANATRSFFTR